MSGGEAASDPWAIDQAAPATDRALVERLVEHAVLAPSGHNTQPWRFRIVGRTLEVRADRSRALPVVDPDDRELTISCGCAILNARVAASAHGRALEVELMPDAGDDDLLARLTLADEPGAAREEDDLAAAIPGRHTNRAPFEERRPPAEVLGRLAEAAGTEGAWLEVLTDSERKEALADLVAEGDRRQMADRSFRRELAAWTTSNRSGRDDGIPGYGFGFSDLMSMLGPLVIRTFDIGRSQAAKDRELATGSPVLAVLGTDADGPLDWLRAGQAHQRVALLTRVAGAWTSYLNQPIEVPDLRPRVAEIAGRAGGHPQLLTRIGYGPDARPTPRRPAREVVDEPPPDAATLRQEDGRGRE